MIDNIVFLCKIKVVSCKRHNYIYLYGVESKKNLFIQNYFSFFFQKKIFDINSFFFQSSIFLNEQINIYTWFLTFSLYDSNTTTLQPSLTLICYLLI